MLRPGDRGNEAMRNKLDGGEAVVQAFRCLDMDYVMASPGSEWGSVWEAFARQKVSNAPGPVYFSCAHETLAVDLAIGYTGYTGRMQGVMLHTGVGLLQGSMGIDAAQRQGIPMVVVAGEALTYGEQEGFHPGPQWLSSLSVVGGPHTLAKPLVKWSNQASSPATLFEQLIRAGEMAQRTPSGPTFMTVPIETQLADWTPPDRIRDVPPAPKTQPPASDIEAVAGLLVAAERPAIVAECSGRDPEAYDALVALAEMLAIPVVDAPWSDYSNFPGGHDLFQGVGQPDWLDEADLVLTLSARAPWSPPARRPKRAHVVAIGETPFRTEMVYQNIQADRFLEGDCAATLRLLGEAVAASGPKNGAVGERAAHWAKAHEALAAENRKIVRNARRKKSIDPIALFDALGEAMPDDAIYADETITHRQRLMRHRPYKGARSYYRVAGGLGQGLGVALGLKLAAKERTVVSVIGDGSFMYNPITQSLALSAHEELPILVVVVNNTGYSAMAKEHRAFYPDGVAAENDLFYGRMITDLDYAELVRPFDGFGRRVEDPAELPSALEAGLAATRDGKTAILNVMVND